MRRILLYSILIFCGAFLAASRSAYAQATVIIEDIKGTCGGANNGSFTITVTGGVPPFSAVIVVPSTSYFNSIPLTLGVPEVIGIEPPLGDLGLPEDNNILVSVNDGDLGAGNFSQIIQIQKVPEINGFTNTRVDNTDNTCMNPNGSITIDAVNGGSGDYDFLWSGPNGFTATTQTITGLAGGLYSVTITDQNANCSFTSGTIPILDPTPSPFTISSPDLTPCAGEDFTVNLSLSEPGVEYRLYVDGNPTGTAVTGPTATLVHAGGLSAGPHTISVLATMGVCAPVFSTNELEFDMQAGPTSAVVSGDDVICAGESTDITVTVTGGVGPYTITLDNGVGTINNYVSGTAIPVTPASTTTYQLVGNVIDANGCTVLGSGSATVTVNPLPTANISGGGAYCSGDTRPTVTFTFTGVPPFNFTYTDGVTPVSVSNHNALTYDIPDAAVGSYAITALSDNNGCLGTDLGTPVAVTENALPTAQVDGGGVLCSGDPLPDVTFTFTGVAPFDFTYTDGANPVTINNHPTAEYTINGAAAGVYSITALTDANGCTATDLGGSADVIVNPLPTAMVSGGGAYCEGSTAPTVTFTFTGALPLEFTYTDGVTPVTVSNHMSLTYEIPIAPVGTYSITALSDNNGCDATALGGSGVVTEHPLPTAVPSGGGTVCADQVFPDVTFTFTGTAPFNFTYTDGSTTVNVNNHPDLDYTIANAPAGTYSVTALTDANGCAATSLGGSVDVIINPLPTATVSGGGAVCIGDVRPDVTFTFTGKAPFDFTYSNGTTTVTINNHNSTTFTINNAPVGTYSITALADDNGCVATDLGTPVPVIENPLPTATTAGGGTVCAGDVLPDVTLTFTGTAPFTFTYTDGTTPVTINNHPSNVFTIDDAPAGAYRVTALTDANGCVATSFGATTNVVVNPLPTATVDGGGEVCEGSPYPSVTFTFTGSVPFDFTYTDGTNSYNLINNSFTYIIPNAAPGTYAITALSDNNGCVGTSFGTPVDVIENPLPTASVSGGGTVCADADLPTVTFTFTGTAPFDFSYTDGGTTVNINGHNSNIFTIDDATAGTYEILALQDAKGCVATDLGGSVNVVVNALPTANATGGGDYCEGEAQPTVTFTFTGAPPFDFTYTDGTTPVIVNGHNALTFDIPNAAEGTYSITALSDNNGCVATDFGSTVTVTETPLPTAGVSGGGTVCASDVLPDVTFTFTGTAPFDFTYTDGTTPVTVNGHNSTTFTLNEAPAGNYSITALTDANGCVATNLGGNVDVIVNPLPEAAISGGGVYCEGSPSPTITFTFTGALPFDFTYSDGSNTTTINNHNALTFDIPNAAVGTYSITALADANGCDATALGTPVSVTENALPVATVSGGGTVCEDGVLPDVTFTFTGIAPFDFTYTDGTTPVIIAGHANNSFTVVNAPAGVYEITALSDVNGCVGTDLGGQAAVMVEPAATAEAGNAQMICAGGLATLTGASVGGSATNGTWSIVSQPTGGDGMLSDENPTVTPAAVTFTATIAGDYTLRLTTDDPGGVCDAASDEVVITVSDGAVVDAGPPQTICESSTATMAATFSGTTGITWSTGGDGGFDDVTSPTAVYTPGPGDILAGTVTLTVETAGPCAPEQGQVVITIVEDPEVEAGPPQTICSSLFAIMNATFGGSATGLLWTTSGDGNFDDPTDPNARYTPGPGDIAALGATLTATATGSCAGFSDDVVLTIDPAAVVDAGDDQSVCIGNTVSLAAVLSGTATSMLWTTSGDGSFSLDSDPNAVYTPGSFDLANGSVTLTATTNNPPGPCGAGTDQVVITFVPLPGDQTTPGNETWIGYVYDDSGDAGTYPAKADFHTSKYRGYIGSSDIGTMSGTSTYDPGTDKFDLNLTATDPLQGPNLCGTYLNTFSVRYKMNKTFAPGVYRFTVGADDGVMLLVDGVAVLPPEAFAIQTYTTFTTDPVCLDGQHLLEIRYFENTTNARLTFDYEPVPDLVTNHPVQVCVNGSTPVLTASSPDADVVDFNWYKDGALVFTGANFTPSGADLDMTATGTTTFMVTAQYNCGETPGVAVHVEVVDGATLNVTPATVCGSGGVVSLLDFVSATPPGGTFIFTGHGQIVGTDFNPAGLEGTTVTIDVEYVTPSCGSVTEELVLTVTGSSALTVPVDPVPVCETSPPIDLTTLVSAVPSGGAFVFSGPGVTGDQFDPGGLSGAQTITVDYAIGGCAASPATFNLDVVTDASIAVNPVAVCENGSTVDLLTLVSASPSGGTFTFSGSGVSGNFFSPAGQSGTVNVNVDYNVGGCTDSQVLPITVRAATDPFCAGGNCATVVIVPKVEPATCTNSDGRMVMSIKPFMPAINNTGVTITIDGISSTGLNITRTIINDSVFNALPVGNYTYTIEYGDPSCIKNGVFSIDQSGTVGPAVVSNIISPECPGTATGSIILDVPGETGNVLQWSLDGGLTDPFKPFTAGGQVTGIPAGPPPTFQQVISIRRNASDPCFSSAAFVMPELVAPVTATFAIADATCNANDGAITSIIPGGGHGAPYTFSLDGGPFQVQNSFTELIGGSYTLSIRDSKGCQLDSTVNVTSPGNFNFSHQVQHIDCQGNAGSITVNFHDTGEFFAALTLDPLALPADEEFKSGFGTGKVEFHDLEAETYYVFVKSATSECATRSDAINVLDFAWIDFDIEPHCEGSDFSMTLTNITGLMGGPQLTIYIYRLPDLSNWYDRIDVNPFPGDGQDVVIDDDDLNFLKNPGEYLLRLVQVQLRGIDPCEVTTERTFIVPDPLSAQVIPILPAELAASYPDIPTGKMMVGNFTGGVGQYSIRIDLDSASSFSMPVFQTDFTPVPLNGNLQYEMSYRDIPPGRYIVEVSDTVGCTAQLVGRVPLDRGLFIPTVFTPNGDGANDVFFIRNLPLEGGENNLVIMNRWGKEVYISENYQNNWDGGEAADGIYFYRLRIASGETITGWVEIMRGPKP